jgi:hypothetical protein
VNLLRRFASSAGARFAYLLLGAALVYYGWMAFEAPRRIEPGLLAAAEKNRRVSVLIHLSFPPERFHILKVQDFGRVRGVSGNTIQMAAVSENSIRTLVGRYYWIRHIDADTSTPQ